MKICIKKIQSHLGQNRKPTTSQACGWWGRVTNAEHMLGIWVKFSEFSLHQSDGKAVSSFARVSIVVMWSDLYTFVIRRFIVSKFSRPKSLLHQWFLLHWSILVYYTSLRLTGQTLSFFSVAEDQNRISPSQTYDDITPQSDNLKRSMPKSHSKRYIVYHIV